MPADAADDRSEPQLVFSGRRRPLGSDSGAYRLSADAAFSQSALSAAAVLPGSPIKS